MLRRTLLGVVTTCLAVSAGAQIVRDGSIGQGPLTLTGPSYAIGASLGQRVGGNLFHSFSQFNVNTGESATFSGPASVTNVISRVTGPTGTNIDGTLRSTIPGANLWLINPHGIAFGAHASLDVPGSVQVSSADYLKLGSSGQFNATNPGGSVLVSAPPSAFGFVGAPAPISVDHSTLVAANGKGLSLVGGAIILNGATLQAPGGEINLASLASAGEVSLPLAAAGVSAFGTLTATSSTVDVNSGPMPSSGSIRILGGHFMATDTTLRADNSGSADGGGIGVRLSGTLTMANGGVLSHAYGVGRSADIEVEAAGVTLSSSAEVAASTYGPGRGGDIRMSIGGSLVIDGEAGGFRSGVFTISELGATGSAGSVAIHAGSVTLAGGGVVTASTFGAGSGGNVLLVTDGLLSVRGETADGRVTSIRAASESGATGPAGTAVVRAGSIELLGGGQIFGGTFGAGAGGSVVVSTSGSLLANGAASPTNYSGILAGTQSGSTGNGGTVSVTADSITLQRDGNISVDISGTGAGGDVNVTARTISLSDNARISTVAFARGAAGTTTVTASESITLQRESRISAETSGTGAGGDVNVMARTISLSDNASISTGAFARGAGGTTTVTASESINVSGHVGALAAGIYSQAQERGDGGSVIVRAPSITVQDGGTINANAFRTGNAGHVDVGGSRILVLSGGAISSSTLGTGHAGGVSVSASGLLRVSGQTPYSLSGIFSDSVNGGTGDAGTVSISAGRLELAHSAEISTDTDASGAGGNVSVTARNIRLVGGGDISSTTFGPANGGNISVSTSGRLFISGTSPDGFSSGIYATASGVGDAGGISVSAGNLGLLASGTISSGASDAGHSGDVRVDVAGQLLIAGSTPGGGASGIFASASGSGDAGNITVRAARIKMVDLGAISSSTFDTGRGGDVNVSATDQILVAGGVQNSSSGIFASSSAANGGDGGSIVISAPEVVLRDFGSVSASSVGGGAAGSVRIAASRSVQLIGNGFIGTSAEAADGGDINIVAGQLVYLRGSSITTSVAGGAGNGGNITIDPQFVVLDNSQIIANAFGGNGGNIRIVADNFLSQNGLVQASSQLGVSGNVVISSPRVDVSGALRVLSSDYLDASRLIRESCASRAGHGGSTLMASGRGGLAAAPPSGQELAERRPVALGCGPLQGVAPVLDAPAPGDHHVAN